MIDVAILAVSYTAVISGLFVFIVVTMNRSWSERIALSDKARAGEVARLQRLVEAQSAYIEKQNAVMASMHLMATKPDAGNGATKAQVVAIPPAKFRAVAPGPPPESARFSNEEGTGWPTRDG